MHTLPRTLIAILLIVIAVLVGAIVIVKDVSSDAVSVLIGVLMGTALAGAIQYWTTEASHRHQLRVAALEKRLTAHQQAYTLWRKLFFAGADADSMVLECQDWWEKNCLYLSPKAREAFYKAYLAKNTHIQLLAVNADPALVKSAFHDIEQAGKFIVEGVYFCWMAEANTRRRASGAALPRRAWQRVYATSPPTPAVLD